MYSLPPPLRDDPAFDAIRANLEAVGIQTFTLDELEATMKDFEAEALELSTQRGIGIGAARELVRQRRLKARLAPAAQEQVRFCGIAARNVSKEGSDV